ncbi:DUF5033 domain-containing protein [Bacteroides sp. HF-5092]|uniref:DUF5033 domain-containing protein n=1 Tax=Bacteroides TaxID=816 RepID=UPI0011775E4A|nr:MULTISPECIES: DUF5033 domain-containing protein [Bacteroides]TRX45449.1 DUF5033 domain-containing protein [Bacteroides sp. HF-5092]
MKTIKFFFSCVVALVFTACSGAESDSIEDSSSNFESMISLYGIESAEQIGEVPSVTTEEMGSVLEALRRNNGVVQGCKVENTEGYYGTGNDKKTVMMTAEYQARTRGGSLIENFALCVSLNFTVDKKMVYYAGATYNCKTDLFLWKGQGASLSTTAEGDNVFTSTSYLYFRVSDQENCLVKVPVSFRGNYDFNAGKGEYSFVLSKIAQ